RHRAALLAALRPGLPAAAEPGADDAIRAAAGGAGHGTGRDGRGVPGPCGEPADTAEQMTMEPLRHIKPSVRSIAAYTLAARPAAVKLNQNENPYDLPDAVKERVVQKALARPWARYPEFDPRELIERLAAFAGWRPDGVLAGNGSNELIEA